jgi:hypothetical protein
MLPSRRRRAPQHAARSFKLTRNLETGILQVANLPEQQSPNLEAHSVKGRAKPNVTAHSLKAVLQGDRLRLLPRVPDQTGGIAINAQLFGTACAQFILGQHA